MRSEKSHVAIKFYFLLYPYYLLPCHLPLHATKFNKLCLSIRDVKLNNMVTFFKNLTVNDRDRFIQPVYTLSK